MRYRFFLRSLGLAVGCLSLIAASEASADDSRVVVVGPGVRVILGNSGSQSVFRVGGSTGSRIRTLRGFSTARPDRFSGARRSFSERRNARKFSDRHAFDRQRKRANRFKREIRAREGFGGPRGFRVGIAKRGPRFYARPRIPGGGRVISRTPRFGGGHRYTQRQFKPQRFRRMR